MHLAAVDYMAVNGKSFLHKAGPHSKILMTLLLIAGVLIADSLAKLGLIFIFTAALVVLSEADLREILHLIIYPAFFSIVFALIGMQRSVAAGLAVLLRAIDAAMAVILLITTTSYVDIFAVLSIFLPGVILDIFIFTYRSLFILLEKLEDLLRSIRLRGGYHPLRLALNFRNTAGMIGVLIIHSFDMSDRLYRIYTLRGYSGRIPLTRKFKTGVCDVVLVVVSVLMLTGVIIKWSIW
ncbi:MAG TPA: CbiQ family ECF transporter T component [Candidatus Atribacteria bacterium]|nr:CbiQ family ECF transporter T component [Candidatus Atribacteria bacterium]HPT77702.1 CbiQ family ECF transporter T component [Candidatus Atribacteria bacterium]